MTANDATRDPEPPWDHDVLVVGSGFGGSVTALRLTEKGWSVGVLEAGRRYTRETLPRTSWQLRRYLWAPRLGLRGIQRIDLLRYQRPDAEVAEYRFKAVQPIFDINRFSVCGEPLADGKTFHLWAKDHDGWLAMDATATIK